MRRRLTSSALACMIALSMPLGAAAQEPSTESEAQDPRQAALEAGREAMDRFREGRYADAYALFEKAERLVHSPVFVLHMARCKRRLGELIAARRLYGRVRAEALAPDAPEPWKQAWREAGIERRETRALIPRIRVDVRGAPAHLTVRVDGRVLRRRDESVEVDPGEHLIEAWRGSEQPVQKRVEVAAGSGLNTVSLALGHPPPRPALVVRRIEPPPQEDKSARRGAIAMFAIGGVSLALGIATGIAAVALDSSLDDDCGNDPCHPVYGSDVSAFHGTGHTASVTLPLGGALVGGGLILWFTTQTSKGDEAVAGLGGRF